MARRSLSRLQRVRIFDAASGCCHLCGQKIHVGERWDADHVVPLWLGGEDAEANMRPAHVACHREKSTADQPVKAKTDRLRANHLGVKKTSSRPLPGSRASGLKRKFDGTVERRS